MNEQGLINSMASDAKDLNDLLNKKKTASPIVVTKAKKLPFAMNRIVFGAPGTGKSHMLEKDQKKYFSLNGIPSNPTVDAIVKNELSNIGNAYSKCYALGFTFAEFFKGKKPKYIKETYGCNGDAAYITSQGERSTDFFKTLPEYKDEDITVEKIKAELKKLDDLHYMKEAGSAAVGRKYSSFLYGKSISEICDELGLVETHTQSRFIWYGAQSVDYTFEPGKEDTLKLTERVTFHPNYSYAQFVGAYKPIQDPENPDNIKYSYVPGPFMRVYTNAINHPEHNFLLLIEEINRANVASVFGDVFQLLDRYGEKGDSEEKHAFESEYPVAVSEDLKKYLLTKGISSDELRIPDNMYIWATMNSADQGVLPMDAAFKRRWDFEYLGIDDGEFNEDGSENETFKSYVLPIPSAYDSNTRKVTTYKPVSWNKIRHAINNKLNDISGVNEDKLLGPYFISKSVLEKALEVTSSGNLAEMEKICSAFKSKVLMYLYEDVVKMSPTDLFSKTVFDENKPVHYSYICSKFNEIGLDIFDKDFVKD